MSNMPRGTFMQVMEKYTKSLKAFISAQGFGHYSKPNGGIPKTDLDQSVQTSLGKADSALQGFTETDPTVPAWAKASSKPSYTASEVGLGNVGNFKAVSTVASQGLSDTEKANARTNIGGGTYSKPSGGIPKTDLASAVQTSLGKADSALQSETDPTVPAWAKAASKPSYTASEVGLGNVGNFKAVSTVASQGLSDTEKSNARANIGAGTGNGTYSKPSGGIPKTDLASAVQTSLGLADGALQHTTVSGSPDLDTYLTTGVYHIATSTATHAPTTNHATLFVDATVGTPYQIFKPDNVDSPWYTRHRSGSAWTSWVAMKFTDTTYSAATTSAAGLMSAADKTKLNGIATGANNYTHPTTAGNKHIPSGGSSGQILVYGGSSGTASWGNDISTASIPVDTFATFNGAVVGIERPYDWCINKHGKHITGFANCRLHNPVTVDDLVFTINPGYRPSTLVGVLFILTNPYEATDLECGAAVGSINTSGSVKFADFNDYVAKSFIILFDYFTA